jgi:hypothetical protein
MIPPPPPLPVEDLPAGHQLHVGRYVSTVLPDFDFETYSEAGYVWAQGINKWTALPGASQGKKGLSVVGAMVYARHPTAEVLCLAYNLKDGRGRRRWRPGEPWPVDLYAHVAMGKPLAAWNVGFEWKFWEFVMVPHHGAPPIHLEQLYCDMAKARAYALPPSLAEASAVLGLPGKDKDGKRLIEKLTVPRNPTKANPRRRYTREDEPADFARFDEYNEQDIVAEAQAAAQIPDLTPDEREYWLVDQAINRRGIAVDVEGLHACIAIIEAAHAQYNAELYQLTGGTVARASEIQKLQGWLGAHGVHMASLDDDAVTEALARFPPLPPIPSRALQIRAAVGSASVKKVFAMRNQLSPDGRLHDLYVFHGARTGRPTGYGPQPTNLPNSAGVYVYRCDDCSHHFSTHRTACPWCGSSVE